MAENIAFSDWSEKLDTTGTNHWLPAYGLQQPPVANGHLQQNDLSFDSNPHDYFDNNEDELGDGDEDSWSSFNQNSYNGNLVRSTSYIFLETILEETSDDLRTDSERSSEEDFRSDENWSVKNRGSFNLFDPGNNKKPTTRVYDNNDPGVHDDDDDDDDDDDGDDMVFYRDNLQDRHLWTTTGSGSAITDTTAIGLTNGCAGGGSLLQFECLEKQCEQTVFRTTATATPFMTNSAESLNSHRPPGVSRVRHGRKHQAVADDDYNCVVIDEDEAMSCSTPFSSYAGDGSSVRSLSKSVESVHSAASRKRCNGDGLLTDVSQSLDDLRGCLDDGRRPYGDHAGSAAAAPAACVALPAAGVIYKTVDCLIDPTTYRKAVDETDGKKTVADCVGQQTGCKLQQQQRSSENLSEDSGFGDQVPRGPVVQTYKPIAEDENYFEMSTKSIVPTTAVVAAAAAASAVIATDVCGIVATGKNVEEVKENEEEGTDDDSDGDEINSKFSAAWHSYPDLGNRPSVTAELPTTDDDDDNDDEHRHRHHRRQDGTMASRLPVSSTPNLCADDLLTDAATGGGGDYMRCKKLLDSTVSLDRSHSLKRIHYESESALSAASSRGSNLLITTSFVSLAAAPTPNRGVHFCPVVSEVNWRESFSSSSIGGDGGGGDGGSSGGSCTDVDAADNGSDEPPETEDVDDDDDDDYDRVSDEVDENIDTMVMKLLTGFPSEKRRPSVAEKQHLRERLDFITGGSPPMSHRICAAPTGAAAASNTGSAAPPVAADRVNSRRRCSVQSRPAGVGSTAPSSTATTTVGAVQVTTTAMSAKSKTIGGKLGGFFQRFSLRRLSGRRNKDKKKQKAGETGDDDGAPAVGGNFVAAASSNCSTRPDTPPPPPPATGRPSTVAVGGKKPPLPPQPPSLSSSAAAADGSGFLARRRLTYYDECRGGRLPSPPQPPALPSAGGSRAPLPQSRSAAAAAAAAMSRPEHRAGLLETDLDSNVTRTSSSSLMMGGGGGGGCSPNKKARSLLDLGAPSAKLSLAPSSNDPSCRPSAADGSPSSATDYRAKSMEFLLDKENQAAVQAPENELRKVNVNGGERILSEHELRIQRSLQRLNLPEWYKTSNVPAQGFLLKRNSDAGYTTSMSSLSSNQSHSPKTYTNYNNTLLSPQTHAATKNFSRWSTSRLNGSNSNSTSPCSSTRSSFNYRQPYLGWRSQEKLSKPRTPAERLAAGLLAQQQHEQTCQTNLSEVQSSIKEVTSAIANYVSSSTPDGSKERLNTDYQDTPSRCPSLRGSTGRLCWLESSFVGNKRSSLTKDTPPFETNTSPSHRKATPIRQTQNNGNWVNGDEATARKHAAQRSPGPGAAVRCRYSECQRSATAAEARRTFKMCHNCNHVYCSRRCRRAHWQNHRKTCLDRRTAALCRSIVDAVRANDRCVERLSAIARRGYLEHGRGAVKCYWSGVELADRFIRSGGGGDDLQCEPAYVRCPADAGPDDPEQAELERLCKAYDPDARFVLHVSVCVQSEVPGPPGPVQWERHLVYKCVRLHLDKSLVRTAGPQPPPTATTTPTTPPPTTTTPTPTTTTTRPANAAANDGCRPDTLILTSVPGYDRRNVRTARRVCFANVQLHLRQRGVELRRQFPDVYRKLCEYVDGDADATFTPVTVYPRDRASGKTFMCVVMPDTEPEKLDLLQASDGGGGGDDAAAAGARTTIIDVGRDAADDAEPRAASER